VTAGGRRGEPCVEAEIEAGAGLLEAEDLGGFELGNAVEEGPERYRSLVSVSWPREGGYVFDDEVPEGHLEGGFFALGFARQKEEFIKVGIFASKSAVGAGDAADSLLGRGFADSALHGRVEKTGHLGGEGRFENRAIGEVAIEGGGC